MQPTVGRSVLYLLSQDDIDRIHAQLAVNPPEMLEQLSPPRLGQPYAATVTAVTEHPGYRDVNLRILMDGPYDFFAPSRQEGAVAGTWSWPPRAGG